MRIRNMAVGAMVVGVLAIVWPALAQAQEAQHKGHDQQGQHEQQGHTQPAQQGHTQPAQQGHAQQGQQGRPDPAQMHQQYMQRIKEALQMGDDAWKALQPKLEKVMTLSRDAGAPGGGGMFPGGRGATADKGQPQSDVAKATQELRAVLDNKAATADEIKAKLTALREAREKAKQELAKAKDDLRAALTQRQEAQLVLMGILD